MAVRVSPAPVPPLVAGERQAWLYLPLPDAVGVSRVLLTCRVPSATRAHAGRLRSQATCLHQAGPPAAGQSSRHQPPHGSHLLLYKKSPLIIHSPPCSLLVASQDLGIKSKATCMSHETLLSSGSRPLPSQLSSHHLHPLPFSARIFKLGHRDPWK